MSTKTQTKPNRAFIPPKPRHPEDNPVPVPQRAKKSARQILQEIACRIEGFIIGALVIGLLAYTTGRNTGERSAEDCWAALGAVNQYQQYSDHEFQKFERGAKR